MTSAESSGAQPQSSGAQAKEVAAAALVLGAEAAEISAEAEERDRPGSDPLPNPSVSGVRPRARSAFVPRRREPARRPRAISGSDPTAVPARQSELAGDPDPEEGSRPETRSELRDWIKDNATLLSNASLLISLATIALSLLPDVGFFSPYIKALLFAAALLLLTELHHQWPEDLQLNMLRRNARPENHSWRMIGFALVMQIATIVFAAFYRWYFRRHDGLLARSVGIIALIAVLLISELLMVIVWAAVTGEEVTIELWAEDRPGLQIDN
jgi:hypothetical protein